MYSSQLQLLSSLTNHEQLRHLLWLLTGILSVHRHWRPRIYSICRVCLVLPCFLFSVILALRFVSTIGANSTWWNALGMSAGGSTVLSAAASRTSVRKTGCYLTSLHNTLCYPLVLLRRISNILIFGLLVPCVRFFSFKVFIADLHLIVVVLRWILFATGTTLTRFANTVLPVPFSPIVIVVGRTSIM